MGAFRLLLATTPPSCSCSPSRSSPPNPTAKSLPSSTASSELRFALASRRRCGGGVARSGRAGGGEGDGDAGRAAAFFGEDGVVEDMDGYLNYLSLEYDSVWDTKPAWCQPWTIVLSGAVVVACSWLLIHSVVITAATSFFICAWWYIFLYSYPKAYSDMIAERREKVASGVEDTYGMEKTQ